ncbi:hypothetical protein EYC84_004455 [Monilinia fructicola]|uniref:Uncharacterized protein n=1 Tax=Monilinia fructicola TaxID=38448 RepID=A0A5M9K170_MONFR|nr:hypothetical protein EYC84_004455 [Monilinia fructicola]
MADHTPEFLEDEVPLAPSHHQMVHCGLTRQQMVFESLVSWAIDYEGKDPCPICFEELTTTRVDVGKDIEHSSSGLNNGRPEFPILVLFAVGSSFPDESTDSYDDAQSMQRSHSIEPMNTFPSLSNPLTETMGMRQGDMMNLNTVVQRSLRRSLSFDSTQSMTMFERQRWNARMGGLGFRNPFYDDPRSVPTARSDGRGVHARSSTPTTTHGHPPITSIASLAPNTTLYSRGWMRRDYPDVNLSSHGFEHENNNTQPYILSRETNNSFLNQSWLNWNHVSARGRREFTSIQGLRNHHRSIRNALELGTGVGTGAGMPRGERTTSSWRGSATPRSAEPTNEYSIARAMGHVLGMATVIGMPRAEWRNPGSSLARNSVSSGSSIRTQLSGVNRTRRVGAASSIEEDLAGLPRLGSSMWAHSQR